jgi:hypothetical protein
VRCSDEDVDAERSVIYEEWRQRRSAAGRADEDYLQVCTCGSRARSNDSARAEGVPPPPLLLRRGGGGGGGGGGGDGGGMTLWTCRASAERVLCARCGCCEQTLMRGMRRH